MRAEHEAFLLAIGFRKSTLNLLSDVNISLLASDYKNNQSYKVINISK